MYTVIIDRDFIKRNLFTGANNSDGTAFALSTENINLSTLQKTHKNCQVIFQVCLLEHPQPKMVGIVHSPVIVREPREQIMLMVSVYLVV